jgi:hypothetical protein
VLSFISQYSNLKLRIYRNNLDAETRVRLVSETNHGDYCPVRNKEMFYNPMNCFASQTIFRQYFPKSSREHQGGMKESFIDGLYFEHRFNTHLVLCFCIVPAFSLGIISAIIVFSWLRAQGDLVGGSHIAAFILSITSLLLAVGFGIPNYMGLANKLRESSRSRYQ